MKPRKTHLFSAAVALVGTTWQAHAASGTWQNTGTDWNTNASWSGAAYPGFSGTGDTATFNGAPDPAKQPTVSGPITLSRIEFNDDTSVGYTVSGSSAVTLTSVATGSTTGILEFNGLDGTDNFNPPIILGGGIGSTQRIYIDDGSDASPHYVKLNGNISSPSSNVSVYFDGDDAEENVFVLGGTNTWTGNTTIETCTVNLATASALPGGTVFTTGADSTLNNVTGSTLVLPNNFSIGGTTKFGCYSEQSQVPANQANDSITINGTTTVTGNGTWYSDYRVQTGTAIISGMKTTLAGAISWGTRTTELRSGYFVFSSTGNTGSGGASTVDSVNYFIGVFLAQPTVEIASGNAFGGGTLRWEGSTVIPTADMTIPNTILHRNEIPILGGTKNVVFSGDYILGNGAGNDSFTINNSGTTAFSGGFLSMTDHETAIDNQTLTLNVNGGDVSISNVVQNKTAAGFAGSVGTLTKAGTGKLTLSGTNTFSGGLNVTNGTLVANNASALGAATNAVSITGNSVLRLDDTHNHPVGSLTVASTAAIRFAISLTSGVNAAVSSAGTITLNGPMHLDLPLSNPADGATYTVIGSPATYGPAFSVSGWPGNVTSGGWTHSTGTGVYTFKQSTGIVTFAADSDGDGLPDAWEDTYGLDKNDDGSTDFDNGPDGDPDEDGFTNTDEFAGGSNPQVTSSVPGDFDGDGLADAWEKIWFPGDLTQLNGTDHDFDGYSDHAEEVAGSSPNDITWTPIKAKLAHRWSFTGDLTDSVGGSNATIVPGTTTSTNVVTQNGTSITVGGGVAANSDAVSLGTNLISEQVPVTIEAWATQNAVRNWARIFQIGTDANSEVFMAWTQGINFDTDYVRMNYNGSLKEMAKTCSPYTLGTQFHIVMTLTPAEYTEGALSSGTRVNWYVAPAGTSQSIFYARGSFNVAGNLSTFPDVKVLLAKSFAPGDDVASASYDEVRIWKGALTAPAIETLQLAGPDKPSLEDTDTDGLYDSWEEYYFTVTGTQDGSSLAGDGDASNNAAELAGGSNPEVTISVPNDIDGDSLGDDWEVFNFAYIYNPNSVPGADPDADYDTNLVEFTNATNPNNKYSFYSATMDAVPDSWKAFFGISGQTSTDDLDETSGDGLTNSLEFDRGTNPTLIDTDGDGLSDGSEYNTYLSNPRVVDTDGDGLTDYQEVITYLTNPNLVDTDGDSFTDKYEIEHGGDPNVASSLPTQPTGWTLLENFQGAGMTVSQTYGGVNGWTAGATSVVAVDPNNGGNKVGTWGPNDTISKPLTSSALQILNANTGTIFFRAFVPSGQPMNRSITLSDTGIDYFQGEVNVGLIGSNIVARDPAAQDTGKDYQEGVWMNFWMIANNAADTYEIYVESPVGETTKFKLLPVDTANWVFRNGAGASPLVSFVAGSFDTSICYVDDIYIDPTGANTTNPLTAIVDTDNDQMGDIWEGTYGLNVGINDSADDLDHDGTNNLTEFRLGLIPNNGTSFFKASLSGAQVTWQGVAGLSFTIQRSTELSGWTNRATVVGVNGTNSYTDPSPPVGKAFYRVLLNP
ncbi:MAG: autotransporter-associated beta strand repeat-containing protein [Verrucomicrobiota bacterium]